MDLLLLLSQHTASDRRTDQKCLCECPFQLEHSDCSGLTNTNKSTGQLAMQQQPHHYTTHNGITEYSGGAYGFDLWLGEARQGGETPGAQCSKDLMIVSAASASVCIGECCLDSFLEG